MMPPAEFITVCKVAQTFSIITNQDLLAYASHLEMVIAKCQADDMRLLEWATLRGSQ